MKKLLIKNTLFISGMNADQVVENDILISEELIEEIAPSIEDVGEYEILDVSKSYVSPGFIDSHVHIAVPGMTQYKGMEMGVDVEKYGIQSGVSALIDAGTFGADLIETAIESVKEKETQVFFLINASKIGIQPNTPELEDLDNIDLQAARDVYSRNKDRIVGVKARASISAAGSAGIKAIAKAKELACELGLPMMVHIGNGPPDIVDVLDLLTSGDVITHCFHGKLSNAIVNEDYALRPATIRARERGVLFDVGHGSASFNYLVASKCFSQGFTSDLISTDLHSMNCNGPVFSLPLTISKMFLLDEDVTRWIAEAAVNPAKTFHIGVADDEYTGKPADLVVFKVIPTDEIQYDSDKNPLHLTGKIDVQAVIKGNHIIETK